MRWLVVLTVAGCATTATTLLPSGEGARRAEEGARPSPVVTEPWCSIDDVIEGPVSAALHYGGRTMACRLGPSPKQELIRQVQRDAALRRCLESLDAPAWAELELQVDGHGRVARIEVEDGDEEPLGPCVGRLRALRAMALGCRWKATVTLGRFALED